MFLLISGLLDLYYILLLFKSEQYSHNNDGSNHNKDAYADVRKPDAEGINGETAICVISFHKTHWGVSCYDIGVLYYAWKKLWKWGRLYA